MPKRPRRPRCSDLEPCPLSRQTHQSSDLAYPVGFDMGWYHRSSGTVCTGPCIVGFCTLNTLQSSPVGTGKAKCPGPAYPTYVLRHRRVLFVYIIQGKKTSGCWQHVTRKAQETRPMGQEVQYLHAHDVSFPFFLFLHLISIRRRRNMSPA